MVLSAKQIRTIVAVEIGIGFILRLALALGLGISRAPVSDEIEYDSYAWNLAQGQGYRGISPDVEDTNHLTAYRPPGISLVWAGVYFVLGHHVEPIRVLHCMVAAATVGITFYIGRRCFNPLVGLLGAGVYAVYPSAVFSSTTLLSEPLGTLWFLAYILACLQFAERPGWGRAVRAGLFLGFALLSRPNPALMVGLTGVWVLWQFRSGGWVTILQGLTIPATAGSVMIPWIVRNYILFHAFIPISTLSGSGLLMGNNRIVATDPIYYGYSIWDTKIPEYREALQSAGNEVERDRRAKAFAIEWLRENTDKWPRLALNKTIRAWTPFLQPTTARHIRWATLLSWGPVFVCFLLGVIPSLVAFLRHNNPAWLIHLAILNNLILNVIFWGEMRYRHSIEPICILIAASFLICVARWLRPSLGLENPLAPSTGEIETENV